MSADAVEEPSIPRGAELVRHGPKMLHEPVPGRAPPFHPSGEIHRPGRRDLGFGLGFPPEEGVEIRRPFPRLEDEPHGARELLLAIADFDLDLRGFDDFHFAPSHAHRMLADQDGFTGHEGNGARRQDHEGEGYSNE